MNTEDKNWNFAFFKYALACKGVVFHEIVYRAKPDPKEIRKTSNRFTGILQ